jgi:hypothetical protein
MSANNAIKRYVAPMIEARTSAVSTYVLSNEAYTELEFEEALQLVGFTNVEMFPSLNGSTVDEEHDLPSYLAKR